MRRGRILVADDNRDAAESLALVLRFSGYEVSIAFGGAEALEIGQRERPRAAIIDIGMPGMSGHEVARRMRLEAWGRNAVLIALTGWGQEQDKQAAKAAGFDEHLTKPVDPDDVERVLDDLLGDAPEEPGAGDVDDSAAQCLKLPAYLARACLEAICACGSSATICNSSRGSTGLARCPSKPALSAAVRSSSRP